MPEPRLHELIAASLDALHDELPAFSTGLRRELGELTAELVCAGTRRVATAAHDRVHWLPPTGPADVVLTTDERTVRALLLGHTTLADAVWAGRLDLKGPVPELAQLHDVLRFYLSGMVRSRSGPDLVAAFQEGPA